MAMDVLGRVRRGEDPSGERLAYRQAPTMTDLAERFMSEHARPKKKPSSVRNAQRTWEIHVLPTLGKRKVADVTRDEVSRLRAGMEKTPYAANRMLALLSKAFNLCEVWGWRRDGSNPCRHVTRYREERRERFLSMEELAQLAATFEQAERQGQRRPSPSQRCGSCSSPAAG